MTTDKDHILYLVLIVAAIAVLAAIYISWGATRFYSEAATMYKNCHDVTPPMVNITWP
jgi:hypothetical protein